MNKRAAKTFIEIQKRDRVKLVARLELEHGKRTVAMAMGKLDQLTDTYTGGMDSLTPMCRHLFRMRGESRSWNLAHRIFAELLKNLVVHLDKAEAKLSSRRRVNDSTLSGFALASAEE